MSTLPPSIAPEDAQDGPFDLADPNSPLAPIYCRTGHVLALLLLALVFILVCATRVRQTDIWGHMRFGEAIVQQRQLPAHEDFSGDFADQSAPLYHFYWLGQVVLYEVFELGRSLAQPDPEHQLGGGLVMLGLFHATIVTLRLGILLVAFRRRTGSLPFAVLGVTLLTLCSLVFHLTVLRPQIFGELGFALVLLALSRPVLSRAALAWLPLTLVVWANCHGSFPVAFVILGLALFARTLALTWETRQNNATSWWGRLPGVCFHDTQVRRLAAVLLIAFPAVCLLNPHGIDLIRAGWELSRHPNIATFDEWRPPPVNLFGVGLTSGLCALALLLLFFDRRRVTAFEVLLLGAFYWQTLSHARMLVWWLMVVTWVAIPHLQAVWRRGLPGWMAEMDQLNLRKTILAVLAPAFLVLWTPAAAWLFFDEPPLGSKRVHAQTPLAADAYLRDQYAKDPTLSRCVFTSETTGEYLLWDLRLDPPVRLTAYTHVHLLRPEHWQLCLIVKTGSEGWEQVLDAWGVQFLVVEPASWHTRLMDQVRAAPERWEIVPDMGSLFVAKYRGKRT